ncbi:DUF1566 domain-containing protein [Herbaspirillum sp. RV1423]|uniref:DUF1566 domain-containing protein n=1 Tax=Herbaspirillum sp. RV1423 TaxID=1443993 RepID=UPI0004B4DF3A|nr:DUF1566 domain-containing protein [Herbaspirillum sp. RV1423]
MSQNQKLKEEAITLQLDGAKLTVDINALFSAWLQKQMGANVGLVVSIAIPSLNDGEVYAGIILSEDGKLSHHLILLPGEAEEINHADATAWAENLGGSLPARAEQSLLFANAKKHFKSSYYWSSELNGDGWAWSQYFNNGDQYSLVRTDDALRARAVRRLVIQ